MDCRTDRDAILGALELAQDVAQKRGTIPVLQCVLLDAAASAVTVHATDQEVGVRQRVTAVTKRKGSAALNARKLYECVRALPEGEVAMAIEGAKMVIVGGKRTFKLPVLDARDFPAMPQAPAAQVTVPAATLAGMLKRTMFTCDEGDDRTYAHGVQFEPGEGLRLIATDGKRMSIANGDSPGVAQSALVPKKGLGSAVKMLEATEERCGIAVADGMIYFAADGTELSMRLLEGEFPDWRQVIRDKSALTLTIGAAVLLDAMKGVALMTQATRSVKMALSANRLVVSAETADVGDAHDELECEYAGADLEIGVSARYMIDALGVLDGEARVELGFEDAVSPIVLAVAGEPGFRHVIMPIRI